MKIHHFFLVLSLLILAACGKKDHSAETNKPAPDTSIPVKVVDVSSEVISVPVQVSGIVSASNEARPAFKTGGIIARILVEEGAFVRQGQLLATLNLTEINAQVQQANEAVSKSKRDLTRAKNLYADSVAGARRYDRIERCRAKLTNRPLQPELFRNPLADQWQSGQKTDEPR